MAMRTLYNEVTVPWRWWIFLPLLKIMEVPKSITFKLALGSSDSNSKFSGLRSL